MVTIANYELKRWQIGLGIGLLVFLVVVLPIYSKFNNINKEGVDLETQLNAQYLDNQNELSSYISGFYEQTGIAKVKADKLDKILLDAVKGRYDGKTSAQPGGGSLFSAIAEAYPDLSGLNIYDKIQAYVVSGRKAYADKQSKLLDMLRSYDKWRKSGLIHKMLVSMSGFPSEALRAQIGTTAVHGKDAEDQMYVIVLTSAAADAYRTGNLDPLQIPDEQPSK